MNSTTHFEYLEACGDIAREAGRLLMGYFQGSFATQHKADLSPVTDADLAANRFICEALQKLTPRIPVIAEENESFTREEHSLFWLVDPLDGTQSFVRGDPHFSVNIGLIKNRRPILGVIYAPPQEMLYYGVPGKGAFRRAAGGKAEIIRTRVSPEKLTITRSLSHPSATTTAYLKNFNVGNVIRMSSAVKFCLVAEGQADIYPRFGRTMEWDTAAGHAIVEAAGGRVELASGQPLIYGKPDFANPPFIAFGSL